MFEQFNLWSSRPAIAPGKRPDEVFNLNRPSHLEYLSQQLDAFDNALKHMKRFDAGLITAASIMATCIYGFDSFFILSPWMVNTVGLGACAYLTHYAPQRETLFTEYHRLLMGMLDDYRWAMATSKTSSQYQLLGDKTIQRLVTTLGPLFDYDTACTWQREDIPDKSRLFMGAGRGDVPEAFKALLRELSNKDYSGGWRRAIYGYEASASFVPLLRNAWPVGYDFATESLPQFADNVKHLIVSRGPSQSQG